MHDIVFCQIRDSICDLIQYIYCCLLRHPLLICFDDIQEAATIAELEYYVNMICCWECIIDADNICARIIVGFLDDLLEDIDFTANLIVDFLTIFLQFREFNDLYRDNLFVLAVDTFVDWCEGSTP